MPSCNAAVRFTVLMALCVSCDASNGEEPTASTSEGSTGGSSSGEVLGSTSAASTTSTTPGPSTSTTSPSASTTDETAGSSSGGPSETTGGTGGPVPLNRYQPSGPEVTLPLPGDDASGVTWNYDTNRLWIVENGAARFHEYAADDLATPIRTISLGGINGNDTEGLVYLGDGEVAIAFESGYGVYIADVPDGDTSVSIPVKQTLTLAPPPPVGNNGLEGIAFDPEQQTFYAVGEGQDDAAPRRFFRFARPMETETDFDWTSPQLVVDEPFDADTALRGSGASLDLAGIAFDARDGNVLIISHTGSQVFQLDPAGDGTVLGVLPLPPNQWEGVALVGPDHDLVLVAERNELQRYALPSKDS